MPSTHNSCCRLNKAGDLNSIGSDLIGVIRSNDCSAWLHKDPVDITGPGEPHTENSDFNVLMMRLLSSQKVRNCDAEDVALNLLKAFKT